jgi:putative aldouronate transport system substrate-binding protein
MKKTRISALLLVALLLATMLPVQADGAAREEVTLTAFIQQSVTSESGIWLGWGAKRLYEDTGIKLDFYPTGNEVEQKLQQYLAADDLPDIIGFKGLDQAQLAMNAEMLLPLDDYADKLPNLFANDLYTNAIAYSKDFTSNDTGKLLIMPTAIGPTGYNSYNWQPMLQWDAWKKAGKQIPATLEEYLDVAGHNAKGKAMNTVLKQSQKGRESINSPRLCPNNPEIRFCVSTDVFYS